METRERRRPVASGTTRTRKAPVKPHKPRRTPVRETAPKRPTPDVVYTQPGPFNRNRFILHLVTVVAVVLALLFGMSIFFKVEITKVTVSGNSKYSVQELVTASGIRDGENLLTLSDAKISTSIIDMLPYVERVRVGIKLPDTVKLEIVELDVVYAAEAQDGSWWLMTADGRIVDTVNAAEAVNHTKLVGVKLSAPVVGEKAVAAEAPPPESQETTETTFVSIPAAEQLDIGISLFQFLEKHGVLGKMTTVDVTDLTALEMWYGQQYKVTLGDTTQLEHKISWMKKAVKQLGKHDRGTLDVSFTTWPDEVGYTPFDE